MKKIGTSHLKMIASGINLVMTVIGFGVSTMFIVFVCTRLLCARIQLNASRRAFPIASRSNLSLVSTSLWFSALFLYLVGCYNVFSMIFCVNWIGFYMVFGFGIEWVELDFSFFFFSQFLIGFHLSVCLILDILIIHLLYYGN